MIARRTRLSFLDANATLEVLPRISEIMAKEKGWSSARVAEEEAAVSAARRRACAAPACALRAACSAAHGGGLTRVAPSAAPPPGAPLPRDHVPARGRRHCRRRARQARREQEDGQADVRDAAQVGRPRFLRARLRFADCAAHE